MTQKGKSILEEAILDAQRIEEALKANTKEILRAVSQEEIDAIVKESLEEEEYEEEDVEDSEEMEDDSEEMEVADDAEEMEDDSEEMEDDEDDEFEDETGGVEGSEDYEDMESDVDVEPVGDMGMSDDEEVMDMTSATDDEVISVYKKLSGEDEIEVVGDEIKLNVSQPGEYVIKTGNGAPTPAEPEMGMGDDMGMDAEPEMGMDADYEDEEEVVYEIALDENIMKAAMSEETKIGATANGKPRTATSDVEKSMSGSLASGDIEGQKAPVGNENDDNWAGDNLEGGFDDDAVSHANGEGQMVMNEWDGDDEDEDDDSDVIGHAGETGFELDESEEELDETKYVGGKVAKVGTSHTNQKLQNESAKKYNALLTESKNLKKENEEFRKTLKTFRGMLAETVVFNSNLTYVTKLFVEHSVTKDEKKSILKRFDDEVSSIKESKKLYKTISNELKSRKPINESVNSRIIKGGSSSASKNLNESTAYVDASTKRMLDLIQRVETREL